MQWLSMSVCVCIQCIPCLLHRSMQPVDNNDDLGECDVMERFVCMFLNPIPHHVAVHFVSAHVPIEAKAHETNTDWLRYWSGIPTPAASDAITVGPMYEDAIRLIPASRHVAMLDFITRLLHPVDAKTADVEVEKRVVASFDKAVDTMMSPMHAWLLRGIGFPQYWEGDFGSMDADTQVAFHNRFGSWRFPFELQQCLDGRIDSTSLPPLLRDMRDWLLRFTDVLHPSCHVPRNLCFDPTVRAFMGQYAVLPHAVALQFCLTADEWSMVGAVRSLLSFGASSNNPCLDPVRRWVMRGAGYDLPELPVPGVGRSLLRGLQFRGHLRDWDHIPYAVALHIGISAREQAMANWLRVELQTHHPAIMESVANGGKTTGVRILTASDRAVWVWLMKSVGRRGNVSGFRKRHIHLSFYRRFGSWRVPEDVLCRLDYRSGVYGLSPILCDMYHWMVEHIAYKYQ